MTGYSRELQSGFQSLDNAGIRTADAASVYRYQHLAFTRSRRFSLHELQHARTGDLHRLVCIRHIESLHASKTGTFPGPGRFCGDAKD
jgi:hypothetical protein